jgi:hypothetical protein
MEDKPSPYSESLSDTLAQEALDLRAVMENRNGRAFVWKLLAQAGVFESVFAADPLTMAFKEGNRNQGLRLLNDINQICPRLLNLAQEEAAARRDSEVASSTRSDN